MYGEFGLGQPVRLASFGDDMKILPRTLLIVVCVLASLAARAADAASPHPDWRNLAVGKAVRFNTPPNHPAVTDPDDAKQMVDGKLSPATPMWYDKSAVGWVMVDPVVFTVDLGSQQPIRGVAMHIPGGLAGVEWPSSIQVYVSETGARYSLIGDLMELTAHRPPEKGYASLWLVADRLETHGRFVKFVCSPTNLGNGAYIFVDEVEVYQGEPAWLDRPLADADAPARWRAAWPEMRWRSLANTIPATERPTRLLLVDGKAEQGGDAPLERAVIDGSRISFTLNGEAGKTRLDDLDREARKARLSREVPLRACEFPGRGHTPDLRAATFGDASGRQRPERGKRSSAFGSQYGDERRPDPHAGKAPAGRLHSAADQDRDSL